MFERIYGYANLLRFPRCASLTGGTSSIFDLARLPTRLHREDRNIEDYHSFIRQLLGVRSVFSYGSGRMGLMEILKALDIGQGDQVILPGYTCIVMPAAIMRVGAKPVYVDIDPETLNMDVEATEAAITPRTRAILAQHTFGIPCDLDELGRIAAQQSIHLIEDCAHALGAKYKGTYCGNYGSAAFFSTEQSKMLSTDRGGIVTTNDPGVAERLSSAYEKISFDDSDRTTRALRRWMILTIERHPRLVEPARIANKRLYQKWKTLKDKRQQILEYDADEYQAALEGQVRDPVRLAAPLALVGAFQLRRLERDVRHRNKLALMLTRKAKDFGWKVPRINWSIVRPSFVRFPFLVENRDGWLELLGRAGIQGGTWLNHPLHPEGSNFASCGYRRGMCPNAERVARQIVNIPVHSRTGAWMIERIEKEFRANRARSFAPSLVLQ
jgi:perosamine synthetase